MPLTVNQIRAKLSAMTAEQAETELACLQHVLAAAQASRDRGSIAILSVAITEVEAHLRELQEPVVLGKPEVTVTAEVAEAPEPPVPTDGTDVVSEPPQDAPAEAPVPKRKKAKKRRKRTVKTNG